MTEKKNRDFEKVFDDIKEFVESQDVKEDFHDAPYALLIEDIDRLEDRDLIFQVLSNSGVDLDLSSIRKQLHSGHLLITHMNEAKAALIVDQIKDIDANIQYGKPRE